MLPNERTTQSEIVAIPGEMEALVAAADRNVARPLIAFLKAQRINIQLSSDADSAFEETLIHRPDVVLIDDGLPPAGGIELCQRLKGNSRTHFVPAVLFTANESQPYRMRAIAAGMDAVFVPSTSDDERRARLWALLRTHAMYRQQERRQRSQGSAIENRRRWVGGFVHDLQSSVGALQANFEYLVQSLRTGSGLAGSQHDGPAGIDVRAKEELEECIRDSREVFGQLSRGFRTVLDFERFEAGRVTLREGAIVLGDLARMVQSDLEWQATSSGKRIDLETSPSEGHVTGDPEFLKQALHNLVGHVLRQTSTRVVRVAARSAEGSSQVIVWAEGLAPPEEERERIFDPYSAAGLRKGPVVAHGLGLALAKVVVDLHGGILRLDSPPGGGMAFVLELKSSPALPNFPTGNDT